MLVGRQFSFTHLIVSILLYFPLSDCLLLRELLSLPRALLLSSEVLPVLTISLPVFLFEVPFLWTIFLEATWLPVLLVWCFKYPELAVQPEVFFEDPGVALHPSVLLPISQLSTLQAHAQLVQLEHWFPIVTTLTASLPPWGWSITALFLLDLRGI